MLVLFALITTALAKPTTYDVRYYNQTLDHFHPENRQRWQHRYLFSDEHWTGKGTLANGCKGPILLYTGNEGPITAFWDSNGFMTEVLAEQFGALLLFPEERYYGESLPFGKQSWTGDNVVYLSTEQVLEDYIELLSHVKSSLNASNCPVVAFGGSYGGTLTTFIRLKYPAAIVGGLAASAPIGYYDSAHWKEHGVSEYTWSDIVARDYNEAHPQCTTAITATINAINNAEAESLVNAFHLCDKTVLGPDNPSELFSYALEGIPQQDYPYAVGSLPAWPVNVTCDILVKGTATNNQTAMINAAATVLAMTFGYSLSSGACLPPFVEGPGGVPGDGPGPDSWGWQSCTENLHPFSSRSAIRKYQFNKGRIDADCQQYFNNSVTPNLSTLTQRYGGYKIPSSGVSNIIWSNGGLDPWGGGGFLEPGDPTSSNHWIFMEKGAHHLDLRAPHPSDPDEVTAARALETMIIAGWIEDFAASSSVN